MNCRCKVPITIVDIIFIQGNYYPYRTEIHEETGNKIYFVQYSDKEKLELPMMEDKFFKCFDNVQHLREEKLNKILN